MKTLKKEITNQQLELLKKVPVLSVPNALKMIPHEHEGNIYYYNMKWNGEVHSIRVNTARQQWRAGKLYHGDDAASLVSFFCTAYGKSPMEAQFFGNIATLISKNLEKEAPKQRIPFKPLPIHGRKWVAKRYDKAIIRPFHQGLCEAMLDKQCYVVYRANCPSGEEDKETIRLFNLIRDTKDLNELSQEDMEAINKNFSTAIALRNVNGGLQLYTGEFTYPEKSEGYCLFGGKEVEQGEKLYVYENIMDYLGLMEQRHANGTEAIMPPAHHLIINGDKNMAEALTYIHDYCDYLNVVCMFPNDKEGRALFEKVNYATRNTAEDASQRLYGNKHFFSLYAKAANIFDYADRDACQRELERLIDQQLEQRKAENKSSQTYKREDNKVIELPSAPNVDVIGQVKESIKKKISNMVKIVTQPTSNEDSKGLKI